MSVGVSHTTTDHKTIQRWIEARDGHPATVKHGAHMTEPSVLRVDFPGYSGGEALEHIGWDKFFEKFEQSRLAFLYEDKTSDGSISRFCEFVSRS